MCNGTHSKAGIASTNDHECDPNRAPVASLSKNEGSGQSHSSLHSSSHTSSQSSHSKATGSFSGVTDTSPDSIGFVRLTVDEMGLHLKSEYLGCEAFDKVFPPGTEVSLMLGSSCVSNSNKHEGTAVITTDPFKQSLLKAAEELQLRQDELKEDFSSGILQLLKGVSLVQ